MMQAADVSGSSRRSAHAQPGRRVSFDSLPSDRDTNRIASVTETESNSPDSSQLSAFTGLLSSDTLKQRKMIWFYYYRLLNKQCNDANDAREA